MNVMPKEKKELCRKMWTEHKDELTKLCQRKLSSHPGEIEDIISEAYSSLCEAVYKGHAIDNPKAWLIGVTNNLIKKKYTEINKFKFKLTHYDEESMDSVDYDEDVFIDSLISDKAIEDAVKSIIESLTPEQQLLYKYVHEDGLKMKEIAKIINISEDAVKERNYRLNKRIRAKIAEYLK